MVESVIKSLVRDVPDFPKPGIVFKDVTPLLNDPKAFESVVAALAAPYAGHRPRIDRVLGIESRGFIFGTPVALKLGCGFVPVRKPNKLPWKTLSESYGLEYGQDTIHIHEDAVQKGDRVLVVDDLLATGGTLSAACRLVERLGATVVACAVVIELAFLNGREKVGKRKVHSLVTY